MQLHPFVGSYLKRGLFHSEEKKWSKELGVKVRIQNVDSLHFMEYRVFGADGEELQLKRS